MYYAMAIVATVLLAFEFSLSKKYQAIEGTALRAGLRFNILSGAFSALIMLFAVGFAPKWSMFSFIMASGVTVCALSYSLISFRILRMGGMAIYSTFLMSGGMLMPYLFGILFLDEVLTPLRLVGVLVILSAVVLSNFAKQKLDMKLLLLCCSVFLLNGMVSILSKCHQINTAYAPVGSSEFVVYAGVTKCILSGVILVFLKKAPGTPRTPTALRRLSLVAALGASGISAVSYMLQLVGAAHLPATVLYPVVTGGGILFSALAGRVFYREKLSRRQLLSIFLCFAGTLLFL